MKILLSVFECIPFACSKGGVVWRYAVELGKSHQVVVIDEILLSICVVKLDAKQMLVAL